MKIAVVCANGRVGRLVVKEGIERELDVTAIARGENKTAAEKYISKDLFELTTKDMEPYDAVVDAFGVWVQDDFPLHSKSVLHLCDILSGTEKRLLVVGGAGSLYTNQEHTAVVADGLPEKYQSLARAQEKELSDLRKRNDVAWTFISPACDFQTDGERSGKYILAGEELTLNEKGESIISYADYAIAMIDEIVNGSHIRKRISVLKK